MAISMSFRRERKIRHSAGQRFRYSFSESMWSARIGQGAQKFHWDPIGLADSSQLGEPENPRSEQIGSGSARLRKTFVASTSSEFCLTYWEQCGEQVQDDTRGCDRSSSNAYLSVW